MAKSVVKQAFEIAYKESLKYDFEVLDVEFVKEGQNKYLRVYIYKPEGISVNDCEKLHRDIDEPIDALDIKGPYYLEVSSTGFDKSLKSQREFDVYAGTKVVATMYKAVDDKKKFEGVLLKRDSETTVLDIKGKQVIFNNKDISKINRLFEFKEEIK